MENKGGKNETLPAAPEQAEKPYFGAVEKFPPHIEMPKVEADQLPEQQDTTLTPPEIFDQDHKQDVVENTMPEVERNAEQIPKQYVKLIVLSSKQLSSKPHELQDKVNDWKDDYLDQAFGRVRGKAA